MNREPEVATRPGDVSRTSDEASLPQLITQLSEQTSSLLRDELRLAQAELKVSAKQSAFAGGLFGTGAVLAMFGVGTLLATAIIALDLVLPLWSAALIITAAVFIAAAVVTFIGKQRLQRARPLPERAIENVKRDIHEVKDRNHHDDNTPQ
jgi:Flp pilus assembly protein TadB